MFIYAPNTKKKRDFSFIRFDELIVAAELCHVYGDSRLVFVSKSDVVVI